MSKLLENKQIIHIAAEVIIIAGVVVYFSYKNKKLLGQIEELSHRVEEQETIIQKHEQVIRQLVQAVNNLQTKSPEPVVKKQQKRSIRRTPKPRPSKPINISFNDNQEVVENNDTDSSSDDSDLDAEIAEEMKDLQSMPDETGPLDSSDSDDDSLKKRN